MHPSQIQFTRVPSQIQSAWIIRAVFEVKLALRAAPVSRNSNRPVLLKYHLELALKYFLTHSIRAEPNELPFIGHANHFRRIVVVTKPPSQLVQQISDCKPTHGHGGHVAPPLEATAAIKTRPPRRVHTERRTIYGGALAADGRCDGGMAAGGRGGSMADGRGGGERHECSP